MALGTLTLHRFNGDETYAVSRADLRFSVTPKESVLEFQIFTEPEALSSTTDSQGSGGPLDAVWQVVLTQFDPAHLVAQKFYLPKGYDDENMAYRTNFYYYEHSTIDASAIEILAQTDKGYRAKLTGEFQDPDFYDNSKPPTRIELEADFTAAQSETALKPVG